MRLTRCHLYVLVGLVTVFVGPLAFTQPGGGRGGRGGGRGMFDPNTIFNQFSGGKDVIVVSEVQVPEFMQRWMTADQLKERMNNYLKSKGITNGQMTREQFADYSEEQRREMMARFQGRRGGGPPGGGPGGPPSAGSGSGGSTSGGGDSDADAKRRFQEMDKNGDGVLSADEVSGRLSREFERWDTNKDGKLQFEEYKAYYDDRAQRRAGRQGDGKTEQPAEERRPVVYRIGKLPKELPAWFSQLDRDKDAQVGLYEWKQAGRDVEEFLKMDLNGDGLLTVEEVLRYQKVQAKLNASSDAGGPGGGGSPPGGGGRGRGGFRGPGGGGGGPSDFSRFRGPGGR